MTEQTHTCQGCGGQFSGRKRKYCTKQCGLNFRSAQHRRSQGIPTRQELIQRAACHQTHECFWCGSTFQPKRKGRDKYCSRECCFAFKAARSALVDQMSASHKVYRAKCRWCGCKFDAPSSVIYCSKGCCNSFHAQEARLKAEAEFVPVEFSCRECGETVQTSYGNPRIYFCSESCSRKSAKRIRRKMERARLRQVQVERVDPIKVFDRDGWRCQICGSKTPKTKRGSIHPTAPELDHIVPLSVGGEHSYRNTQCACRECNGKKGDTTYGQIPMFAT